MLVCVSKNRDKYGNIKSYIIQDTKTLDAKEIEANNLKASIRNGMKVANLKLTIDGKLIDDNVYAEEQKKVEYNRRKLLGKYSDGCDGTKLRYIAQKMSKPRIGRLVTRALLIGLTCVSLATTVTGCSSSRPVNANAAGIEQQVWTVKDKIKMLNSATTIDVDVHNFSLNAKATISVGDSEIGTIQGKFIKIFDEMTFETEDGDMIAKGTQDSHFVFDGWTVFNSDGEVAYRMKEKISLTTKYIITDQDGNELAWLKKDLISLSDSAKVYDMDDNVIATIKQYPMRKDFIIEIEDNSTIDNTSMTSICTQYMMNMINEHKKDNKNKNKDKVKETSSKSSVEYNWGFH